MRAKAPTVDAKLLFLVALCPLCSLAASAPDVPAAVPVVAGAADVRAGNAGSTEQLEELDEVIVRGKRLNVLIEEAEDDFFKLYNQLNRNDKYDVSCPRVNASASLGSLLTTRVCMPGFVADSIADQVVFKMQCEPEFSNFDANRDGRISQFEAGANADLMFQFEQLDRNGDGTLSAYGEFEGFERWAAANLNCPRPPPPELVLMEGSKAWYDHMLKVTNSDPRLRELADNLDGLHMERDLLQGKLQDYAAKPDRSNPVPRNTGPRPR